MARDNPASPDGRKNALLQTEEHDAPVAAGIGILFSTILPTFTSVLPSWWGIHGWFFGVAIGGAVYFTLRSISMPQDQVAQALPGRQPVD